MNFIQDHEGSKNEQIERKKNRMQDWFILDLKLKSLAKSDLSNFPFSVKLKSIFDYLGTYVPTSISGSKTKRETGIEILYVPFSLEFLQSTFTLTQWKNIIYFFSSISSLEVKLLAAFSSRDGSVVSRYC